MLNNKNNIFVKAMFFVVLAIVLTVGVTYAYFRADITGVESESTISVGGATLAIKYEGTETITGENVIPGWTDKKYFNVDVTNTSRKDISYDIKLVVLNSNFYTTNSSGNSYLEYALYECSSEADTTCETVIKSSSLLDIQSGDKLVYTATTNTSVKTYYALELSFPNQNAVQSQTGTNDQPLTFSGYVTIESGGEVYVPPFATDSWATIAANIKSGNTSKYKVGDEKEVEIDMNDDGIKESYTLRIANNSHYYSETANENECKDNDDNVLTSQTACGFVVEFVDIVQQTSMNSSSTNVGGWKNSSMRTYLNGGFLDKLPSDLQSVIADTTVVSGHGSNDSSNFNSTDKLYLLSTEEVWSDGVYDDTAIGSTRQLEYYANKNVSTYSNYTYAVKKFNGTAAWWWLRSACSFIDIYFLSVKSDGRWNTYIADNTSGGVAPAFRIE